MNAKQIVFRLQSVLRDNPSFWVLAVCCGLAAFFIGMIIFPRYFRRLKRRARGKRRRERAVNG